MRSNLIRTLVIGATLAVSIVGLSACVTGYDPYYRDGGYYDHSGYDHHDYRRDDRGGGWFDRDGDGHNDYGRGDWGDRHR
jgi:hypothetical protein